MFIYLNNFILLYKFYVSVIISMHSKSNKEMETNMNYSVLLKQDIYSLGIDFKSLKKQINVVIVHEPKTKKPSHF